INLKSPLFRQNYIETRTLTLEKPTHKEIEKRLNTWLNKTSQEIKHIFNQAEKTRELYKTLSPSQQIDFLQERIKEYDSRE
ncbi:relaxase, partial [Escherichia coli]|nr:relaxase [Escherichia coli]